MSDHALYPLMPDPGIQRDGTELDSTNFIDGQHCRFYSKRPRKIGGYKLISPGNFEVVNSIFVVPRSGTVDCYLGRPSSLSYINFNLDGTANVEVDRTPVVDFTPDPNNTWSFDLMTRDVEDAPSPTIIAQVSANGGSASGEAVGGIFMGAIGLDTPLVPVSSPIQTCSGGVVVIPQYLLKYGNGGVIEWSASDDPTSWPANNSIFAAGTKIVYGARTRGGGVQSGLFWSLNSVVRLSFDAGLDSFVADTIEDNVSIFASNCVVKANQMFFWIGNGQFFFYNGTVQNLQNDMNTDFFFNNVNSQALEKIWGYYNSRYKEIWWFYPSGSSIECNHAIIYNIEGQFWFDTASNRSAGFTQQVFPYPILSDTRTLASQGGIGDTYGVWMHEFGFDQSFQGNLYAIPSHFETKLLMFNDLVQGQDCQIRTRRFEPDFVMTGDMAVQTKNRAFPASSPVLSSLSTFNSTTEKVDVEEMGRIVSYIFSSNTGGGYYQCGKTLINIARGDIRPGS